MSQSVKNGAIIALVIVVSLIGPAYGIIATLILVGVKYEEDVVKSSANVAMFFAMVYLLERLLNFFSLWWNQICSWVSQAGSYEVANTMMRLDAAGGALDWIAFIKYVLAIVMFVLVLVKGKLELPLINKLVNKL